MSTAAKIITADQLFRMPDDGFRYELWEGELRQMTPAGFQHGAIASSLASHLSQYVVAHQLGLITAAETGFLISRDPDTVLAPDIGFVRQTRLREIGIPKSYFPEAPALVVEVVSPHDTVEQVDTKMRRWLTAGVELAWVVHPAGHTVTVYRSAGNIRVMTEQDTLTGDDVVPGFECPVGDLFSWLSGLGPEQK